MKNTLKQLWPVALIAIVSGGVNCLMLWFMRDRIALFSETLNHNYYAVGRGSIRLFMLNAGVLAWASIAVIENRLGTMGIEVFLTAIPFWAFAIGGSFLLSMLFAGPLVDTTWGMLYVSVIAVLGIGGLRTWYGTY